MINRRRMLERSLMLGLTASGIYSTAQADDARVVDDSAPLPDIRLSLTLSGLDGGELTLSEFDEAYTILFNRAEALPVNFAGMKTVGKRRIVVHLAGVDDVDLAIATITGRGLVELIDPRGEILAPGTIVRTSYGGDPWPNWEGTPVVAAPGSVYQTIVTGDELAEAFPTTSQLGLEVIGFRLDDSGAEKLQAFTSTHIGEPMSLVVNNRVVSSPVINGVIEDQGIIVGLEEYEIDALLIQLELKPLRAKVVVDRVLINPALER
jgi:preprotein translocase subunit SecD